MSKNVTFTIEETPDGEFVLSLHNHSQKLVSEQHRSKDIDEVVVVLKKNMIARNGFNNAMLSELQVLGQD
jgi:hypothetical protein